MSKLFYGVLNNESSRGLVRALRGSFEEKQRKVSGTLLTATTIQVEGQVYPFTGAGAAGEALAVVNVGRLAAAEYAPASGAGSVATGGGSSGGSSTSLADHNHSGAAGSGGALAGYAPVIHTHVEAGITDLDHTQALGWIVCTNDAIVINAGEVVWQR